MSEKMQLRRCAERRAIYSSCCGFTGEAVLTESAVIMLYAGMLGAGASLKIVTTAIFPFLSGLLMIPMALLAAAWGCRKITVVATLIAGAAYLLVPAVIWCGQYQVILLVGLLIVFSASLSGFVAGWFPLLDTFLLPERRTLFIGKMRFCHQSSAVIFLMLTGYIAGESPAVWTLQLAIVLAGVIFLGRAFWIAMLPEFPADRPQGNNWRVGLGIALHNKRLLKSGGYIFFLNMAGYGTIPLWILFLQHSGAADNHLIYISAASLAGMMLGYLVAGKMPSDQLPKILKLLHIGLLILGIALFVLPVCFLPAIGVVLALYNMVLALVSVAATGLMFAAATPGNKTMAMAVFGCLGNTGMGCSRLGAAILLNFSALLSGIGKALHTDCYHLILGMSLLLLIGTLFWNLEGKTSGK